MTEQRVEHRADGALGGRRLPRRTDLSEDLVLSQDR